MTRYLDSALLVGAFLLMLAYSISQGFTAFALLLCGVCIGWYAALRWSEDSHSE